MIAYIWHNVWSRAFVVGVLGNLVAAMIWAIPALRSIHRKLDRHHGEHMKAVNKMVRESNVRIVGKDETEKGG